MVDLEEDLPWDLAQPLDEEYAQWIWNWLNSGNDVNDWLNQPSGYGQTPLFRATVSGRIPMIKSLVSRGADVNEQGGLPLYCAVLEATGPRVNGSCAVVECLLRDRLARRLSSRRRNMEEVLVLSVPPHARAPSSLPTRTGDGARRSGPLRAGRPAPPPLLLRHAQGCLLARPHVLERPHRFSLIIRRERPRRGKRGLWGGVRGRAAGYSTESRGSLLASGATLGALGSISGLGGGGT